MFTGGDSSGEGMNFNKFDQFRFAAAAAAATSQPAVPNAATSIDWATLAAQWIQMRDNNAGELDALAMGMPAAAAVPSANLGGIQFFGNATAMTAAMASGAPVYGMSNVAPKIDPVAKEKFATEKGEADMDMDDDEETNFKAGQTPPVVPVLNATLPASTTMAGTTTPPPNPSMQLNLSENVMQRRPEWYGGAVSGGAVSDSKTPLSNIPSAAVSPTNQWNVWPASRQNAPQSTANPTAHIPSLLNLHVPNPNVGKASSANVDPNPTLTAIDAAKRKILPAWLREGLEKMEREKQKQLEQQQQHKSLSSPETTGDTLGDSRSPPLHEKAPPDFMVKNAHLTALVEGENSGNEEDEIENELSQPSKPSPADNHGALVKGVPSKARQTSGDESASDSDGATDDTRGPDADAGKSYEQKLADLMIVVRRTLTELLLEVTNDEIAQIANETVKLRKSKASSAQVIPKTAFSAITNKLGLAAYADSSSGDDNSDDEEPPDNDGADDSEEELKAAIRQKRRNFVKTAEEIEEYVSAAAVREESKLKHYTDLERRRGVDETPAGGKLSESDFGKRGQRFDRLLSRKERTTRFSDNKDAKSMVAATATYISSQLHTPTTSATQTVSTSAAPLTATSTKQPVSSAKATNKVEHSSTTKSSNIGAAPRKSVSDEKVSSHRSRRHREDSSRKQDVKDAKSKRPRRSSSKSSRSDDDYRRKHKKSRQRRSSSSSSSSTSSSSTESPVRRSRRRSSTSSSSSTTSSHPSSKYSRTSSRRSHQDARKYYGHGRDQKDGRHRSSSYRSKRSSRSISKNHDYDKRDSSYEKYQSKRAHHHHVASSSSSSAKHQSNTKTHSSSASSRRQDRSRSRSRSKTRSSHKSSYKRH